MQNNIGREIANTARRAPSCVEKQCKQMRGLLRSWRSALRDTCMKSENLNCSEILPVNSRRGQTKSRRRLWWHSWYKITLCMSPAACKKLFAIWHIVVLCIFC